MKNIFKLGASSSFLIVVSVLLATGLFFFTPTRPVFLLYPLARQAACLKIDYSTQDMVVKESEHFIIKYQAEDQLAANMVAEAAEAAYEPVGKLLNYRLEKKSLIIIYQDRTAIQSAYGWPGGKSAMGFYWGGVIQVLSPLAWMPGKTTLDEFIRQGPMAHEYTHLVLDHLLNGNYPRWFTEGVAQYAEYEINGYQWLNASNSLAQNCYSMKDLEQNFDQLTNQALAYRQSFAIVRYIVEIYGHESFLQILSAMKKGAKAEKAIENILGINYCDLAEGVRSWAGKNMNAKAAG